MTYLSLRITLIDKYLDIHQVIIKNIELGRNWIYDCDIKGFFDNIPHKKLMKVLNKVIADGTVLDLIWSWLKCGYMEDGKYYNTKTGQVQGGLCRYPHNAPYAEKDIMPS